MKRASVLRKLDRGSTGRPDSFVGTGQGIFGQDSLTLRQGVVNCHGGMAQRVGCVPFRNCRPFASFGYHTSDMTALLSAYTKEGFIVGADTLRKDKFGRIVTESAVKIHATGHRDFVGAYGLAGYTAMEFIDGRPMLNILECANGVASELTDIRFNSAQEYVEYSCDNLAAKIRAESSGIALPNDFKLRGMFVGYNNGRAFCLQIDFPASNGYLLRPRLAELWENPVDRFCILSGSAIVWNEMSEHLEGPPETLTEGITLVQEYVTRCIKNDTDPYCANIGGRVQLATVTNQGFSWVLQP